MGIQAQTQGLGSGGGGGRWSDACLPFQGNWKVNLMDSGRERLAMLRGTGLSVAAQQCNIVQSLPLPFSEEQAMSVMITVLARACRFEGRKPAVSFYCWSGRMNRPFPVFLPGK